MDKKITNFEGFSPQRFIDHHYSICVPLGVSVFTHSFCKENLPANKLSNTDKLFGSISDIIYKLLDPSFSSKFPSLDLLMNSGERILFFRMPKPNSNEENLVGRPTHEISDLSSVIENKWPNLSFKILIIQSFEVVNNLSKTLLSEKSLTNKIERLYPKRSELESKAKYFLSACLLKLNKLDAVRIKSSKHHFFNNPLLLHNVRISHTLDIFGSRYNFLCHLKTPTEKNIKPLIIIMGAAMSTKSTAPPSYSWWRIGDLSGYSYIHFDDPAQDNHDLDVGWFLGDKRNDYLHDISSIINVIINSQNIKNEDLIFLGGSSGGFGAIMISSYFRGSSVIVDNPQIIINDYHHPSVVSDAFNLAFGEDSIHKLSDKNIDTTDVRRYFSKINYFPPYLEYCQNEYDSVHQNNHQRPFLNWTNDKKNIKLFENSTINVHNYKRLRYDGKKGHLRMTDESICKRIKIAVEHIYS